MHIDSSVVPALSNGELCLYKIHFCLVGEGESGESWVSCSIGMIADIALIVCLCAQ